MSNRAREPLASVVVPAFNAADTIALQLDALMAQSATFEWDVVVSDNRSRDTTKAVANRVGVGPVAIRYIDASRERGPAFARNAGAAAARGSYVLFCDADDIVGDHWVEAMVGALQEFDVAGGRMDPWLLNSPVVVAWRGAGASDRLPGTIFKPAGIGANMGVRRGVFEALGGFDPSVAAGEDIDFWWRAQLAGYSAGFAKDAVVHYRHRDDLHALGRQAFIYGRSLPHLFRIHRVNGMPRRPLRLSLRQGGWVVLHVPDLLRGRARKGAWIWGAWNLAGRLRGAIEYRVLYI